MNVIAQIFLLALLLAFFVGVPVLAFFVGVPVLAYVVIGHWLAPVLAALTCCGTWAVITKDNTP